MATLHVILVLFAAFSWVFMLSGISKERKNRAVVIQEGKGIDYPERYAEAESTRFTEIAQGDQVIFYSSDRGWYKRYPT